MKHSMWLFVAISLVLHGLLMAWPWDKPKIVQKTPAKIVEVKLISYPAKLPEPALVSKSSDPPPPAPPSPPSAPKAAPKPKKQQKQPKAVPTPTPKKQPQPVQAVKPTKEQPKTVSTPSTVANNNTTESSNIMTANNVTNNNTTRSSKTATNSGVSSGVRFNAAYLNNPEPSYPRMSRRLGEQGQIKLKVQVDAQGKPIIVQINQSSGFVRLDNAAVEAVQKWRFIPAQLDGKAIMDWVIVPIEFKL